jgi:ATP-dependent Zn protease
MTPWKAVHTVRDMVDLMHDTSVQILEEKKRALAEGGEEAMKELTAQGKDIMSVLRE